ncbi:uncharacterized protein CEXT_137441 [Caerostris extrusa]|uniref:Acyltransferase 3 domain-containing protein n=1 Tax=Caerostris extrusa TaxID=172846 RepID=A0AAV4M864_CAEEX|nr:uncharacterized protein CEXT_137441 [Caerostris extrusa]
MICVLTILVVPSLLCTKCMLSFSVISNWKVLMDLESGSDSLSILHGIRFFSMCWIIFGHTYYHLDFKVLKYLQITIELTSQFAFNSITNASLLVDNFFFIRKPVIGLWVNFVIMVASVVGVGIQNYIRDFPPTNLFIHADVEQRTQLMMETYYPPLHHLGPHCLGIFVGYYLRQKMSPKSFHWKWHILAWILTFAFTTSALFGVHPWNNDLPGTGKVATVLYASLSRMSWTIGLAWIVIACSTGCGGFLTNVLSWKPLIPLSRLTFMVYMVHPLIQHVFYSTLREGIQARNSLAVFIYFGFVISSYAFEWLYACYLKLLSSELEKLYSKSKKPFEKETDPKKSCSWGRHDQEKIIQRTNRSQDI